MRRLLLVVVGLLAVGGAIAAAVRIGGEATQFLLAGLQVGPFLILAVLVQLGEKRLWARILAYIWLSLMVLGFSVFVLGLTLSALSGLGLTADGAQSLAAVGRVLLVLLGSLALAGLALLPSVRRLLARFLPIDPGSLTHKVALFFLVFFIAGSLGQLALLGGRPPLLIHIEGSSVTDLTGGRTATGQILDMLYSLGWTLPMALIAAGFPIYRSFRGAATRLGFTRPTRTQVLLGLALAAVLVAVFNGLDQTIAWLWGQLGWPTTNEAAFKKLLGAGYSLPGALAVGVTAGVGEEATTRGLLQPRLGKVLPNLAFAAAHAFQYGPDALISVFLTGMVLAFVRSRSSTTVAALVHGTYDFVSIMLDVAGF